MQRMADLVQRQRHRLIGRVLLEEEADGTARFLKVAVSGMALVARREDRAGWAGIEGRYKLGGADLQGIAIGRRQEAFQHKEAVAPIGRQVGRLHWTTRSMTTGRSAGTPSPMRIARRTLSIAPSAPSSLAAWTMQSGLPVRTWAPTTMTSLRPTDASIASSAWERPPPRPTTAMPTSRAFMPTTWPDCSAVQGFMTGACER